MDWKARLADAKDLAQRGSERVKAGAEALIAAKSDDARTELVKAAVEAHWPSVQQMFRDRLQRPAAEVLYNDAEMARILPMMYQSLPLIVRFVVKEEEFARFCLENRQRLAAREKVIDPDV
jgi:hypothetical protein